MKILATAALFLFFVSLSSSEESDVESPRLFFCPGYRNAPVNTDQEYEKGSEPFRFLPMEDRRLLLIYDKRRASSDPRFFGWNFFGCFVYNLAAFGHHVLDFFLPYYGYPYYREGSDPDRIPVPNNK